MAHDVTVVRKPGRIAIRRQLEHAFDEIGPQNERRGYVAALGGISEYLISAGVDYRHACKLVDLASALSDLDDGIVRPLLRPAHVNNRRLTPSNIWRRRALVALGIEALLKSGLSRDEAAGEAERNVKTICHLVAHRTKPTKPSKAALSWNDELGKGRIKSFDAVHLYKHGARLIGKAMARSAHEPLCSEKALLRVVLSR